MKADSPNWVVLGAPASPAEAAALETFRELLPEDGLTRAWVNLTFIDRNGRLAEVDVILLTKRGLFLVELKGWHGRIDGNQQTWRLATNVTEYRKNPLLLADNKAKRPWSRLGGESRVDARAARGSYVTSARLEAHDNGSPRDRCHMVGGQCCTKGDGGLAGLEIVQRNNAS